VPRAITDNLVFGDADLTGNRLNDAKQLSTNSGVVLALHAGGVDLIDESILTVGRDQNSSGPRIVVYRLIFEIDEPGREEDKKQDESDHDIVLDGATFMGPENIAANCAPDSWHRHRGSGRHYGGIQFNPVQVYVLRATLAM
jgi:hypothetical protein